MNDPVVLMALAGALLTACILGVRNMTAGQTRVSRHPDRVARIIQGTQDPKQLRALFRKWKNPEIRRAAACRLPPEGTAEMLRGLSGEEKEEVLSFHTEMDEVRAIRSACASGERQAADGRLLRLYREKMEACPDPDWLASVIREGETGEIRKAAAEKLTDQERLGDCLLRAAAEWDEELFSFLLPRVENLRALLSRPEAAEIPPAKLEEIREYISCGGRHSYRNVHWGAFVKASQYHPTRLELHWIERCRVCGRRRTPACGANAIPSLSGLPEALREEFRVFREILGMPDSERHAFILAHPENHVLRVAAAERMTDEALILDLLRREIPGKNDPVQDLKTVLLWQLQEHEDGGLFPAIAEDPAYGAFVRTAAVGRIWDPDALQRLSRMPELTGACAGQAREVVCPNGHQWELEREETVMNDESDWGSIRWRVRHYRCARCGAVREDPWEQC